MSRTEELEAKCSASWSNLRRCREDTRAERDELERLFDEERLIPPDTSAVVFGSIARNEWTKGSDVDWTLLVDGPVDPAHSLAAAKIQQVLKERKKKGPGPTGTFGSTAFSHPIVHRIGGEEDSNKNTTQRILLLIESAALGRPEVRRRVLLQVFKRYVDDDNAFRPPRKRRPYVPHFFLNDVVRYWRTMGVDLVQKLRTRGPDEWALRNFKLRMSRKLLFVAGLTMALRCKLYPSAELLDSLGSDDEFRSAMRAELFRSVDLPPLDILAGLALDLGAIEPAKLVFDAYDDFIGILSDEGRRKHLSELSVEAAPGDELFKRSREITLAYQRGLQQLFFDSNSELTSAMKEYGVF